MMKRTFLFIFLFFLFTVIGSASAQLVDAPHSAVQLIAEKATVKPGEPVLLGFDLHLDPGWHIYWQNPGDSGAPPQVKWKSPPDLRASSFKFPYPHRIDYGGLTSYGHEGRALLISEVQVPNNLVAGDEFTVDAHLGFLVCEKICVPADVDLSIAIPVVDDIAVDDPRWSNYFARAKESWPVEKHGLKIKAYQTDAHFHIMIPAVKGLEDVQFFALDEDIIQYMPQQELINVKSGHELVVEKSEFLEGEVKHLNGVLVSKAGWGKIKNNAIGISPVVEKFNPNALGTISNDSVMGAVIAIGFAFIGGLLLNLMPCVLPVLSLKVLGLIKHAEDEKQAWKHGWAFTVGVVFSFLVLAAILVVLREAGEHIGWGFQFQSPGFVIFMAWFLFLLALNLFGVFEIGESLTRINWVKHHGLSASFLSGMLVTIVATPCTAPFMGAALGFALTQTTIVSFIVFFALGFGLALPYLLLTCFPAFLKFVPKPGPWMVKFKFCMGLLMLGTALWFLWILDAQLGHKSLWVMVEAIGLSCVGAWFLFHGQRNREKPHFKPIAVIILIAGLVLGFQAPKFKTDVKAHTTSQIDWIDYAPAIVDDYRQQGRAVFVDFTARWCLTCQVNERVALEHDKVAQAVKDKNIVMIKADWTNYDERITQALEKFGKNSIPFYVLYPPGKNEPIILPEIITPKIVLDAFEWIE